MVLFVVSVVALPNIDPDRRYDMRVYYFKNCRWLHALLITIIVLSSVKELRELPLRVNFPVSLPDWRRSLSGQRRTYVRLRAPDGTRAPFYCEGWHLQIYAPQALFVQNARPRNT